MAFGSHPLTGTEKLPNVLVSHPGVSHWTDAIASGRALTPGEPVVLCASGAKLAVRPALAADDSDPRLAIALKTVQTPDLNTGSLYNPALGPNEIVNLPIAVGEYVHRYDVGGGTSFILTLVDPSFDYNPGDLLGYKVDGVRPDGKDGEGSWAPSAEADTATDVLVVTAVRQAQNGEYILNVNDPHSRG